MDQRDIRLDNRRLGHRVQPDGLELVWVIPGTVPGHKREKKRSPMGRVLDLSFTGMQVLAPLDKQVVRGGVLEVVIGGITTPVRVRWIRPSDEPDMALFGVELLRQSTDLTRFVTSVIESCDVRDGIELREPPVVRRTIW